MRDRIARWLLTAALWVDPDQRFVCYAGKFKFERWWKQPTSLEAGKADGG